MSEDRPWLKAFREMHEELTQALEAKRELDEINLLLKSLDVGQVPGYQPLSAIQGIRKLHRAWQQLAQSADSSAKTATDFLQKNEALRAENAKLRAENNAQDAKADAVIEGLRTDTAGLNAEVVKLRKAYDWLQYEYTNRGAIIQDFAKREHEHQKLIAELEKQIGHMEQVIQEFFPAPIIPAPWEFDPMRIPHGEWVLRSNESLRNRVVELGRQCEINEATAHQWKANYERQMAINARQRSRIGELRLQLRRIVDSKHGSNPGWLVAQVALTADDELAARPITNILTQEAP